MEDLTIVRGINKFDLDRDCKLAENCFSHIIEDIGNIKTHYFVLGYHLNVFNSSEYYKDFGFATMKDFIIANTDLEYSMATRCMSVNKKFCKTVKGGISRFIDKQYDLYNYSQLCEMCSMDEKTLLSVNSNMTVKEIRALKNKTKDTCIEKTNCDIAISVQQEINNIEVPLLDDLDENNYEYFLIDLFKLLEKETNGIISSPMIKGKQSFFNYRDKKYKITLCETK